MLYLRCVQTPRAPNTLGKLGEDIAASFVERHGCSIVARNIRADGGEIDLVVTDGLQKVAIEVKTTSDGSDPADAVDDRKLDLLGRTASSLPMVINRIDIVSVKLSREGVEVRWLRAVD